MSRTLADVLLILRAHKDDLQRMGVVHAAVFGSVARGEARPDSDVDVLVDLDYDKGLNLFDYARIRLTIDELLSGGSDVANRKTLKPLLRDNISREAIDVF